MTRHLLTGRGEPDGPDREYELSEREAEALLDEGVIEAWELDGDPTHLAVYHVAAEFDDAYADAAELWREIEDRLCRARAAAPVDLDAPHLLVIGDAELRPLSAAEAERLEGDGVIYPDKYLGGGRRAVYHVDPGFAEAVSPEPVAEAVEEQLDTVGCGRVGRR